MTHCMGHYGRMVCHLSPPVNRKQGIRLASWSWSFVILYKYISLFLSPKWPKWQISGITFLNLIIMTSKLLFRWIQIHYFSSYSLINYLKNAMTPHFYVVHCSKWRPCYILVGVNGGYAETWLDLCQTKENYLVVAIGKQYGFWVTEDPAIPKLNSNVLWQTNCTAVASSYSAQQGGLLSPPHYNLFNWSVYLQWYFIRLYVKHGD